MNTPQMEQRSSPYTREKLLALINVFIEGQPQEERQSSGRWDSVIRAALKPPKLSGPGPDPFIYGPQFTEIRAVA